jgi:ECF transporter S component (folate family)
MVAFLIAMAVILKSFLSFETGSFRFTFYDIPMMVIGIIFGPVIGGVTGIIVDFFHMMFSPWAFTFNVFTLSNMVWAIIPGLLLFGKDLTRSRLLLTIVIASVLTFGLNTIGIIQFQGMGAMLGTLPYRIGVLFVKLPIQFMFVEVIYERVLVPMVLIPTKQKTSY